jgi:hypothetical protein
MIEHRASQGADTLKISSTMVEGAISGAVFGHRCDDPTGVDYCKGGE